MKKIALFLILFTFIPISNYAQKKNKKVMIKKVKKTEEDWKKILTEEIF